MHPYIAVPAVSLLVLRAWSNNSLTPAGIAVATLTAIVHALHPWPVFFALLVVFFLGGTAATKVKHDIKQTLTLASSGATGGEGPRTHIQVLANSVVASVLILLHYLRLGGSREEVCWPYGQDLLVVGIVSNYAAVAADTFSSELGILSKSKPRLITSWDLREVPPGTNGGISVEGTLAGFLGSFTIALTAGVLLPFCSSGAVAKLGSKLPNGSGGGIVSSIGWGWQEISLFIVAVTIWGGLGSLLDSFLGGFLQASVVDARTGKVIEGIGGKKVPTQSLHSKKTDESSRKIVSGRGLLDNNAVNVLMAFTMSMGGMLVAGYIWEIPVQSILGY